MNKKDKKEIETIEALMGVIYSGDKVTDEDRDQITQLLNDKQYDEEFEESFREFMSEPRNREEDIADGLESLNRLKRKHGVTQEIKTPLTRRRMFRRIAFRAAAVLVPLLIAGGAAFHFLRGGDEPTVQAERSAGTAGAETICEQAMDEERDVILPDGSMVRLRRNARISYAGDFLESRVLELSGDAFFSVAKMNGEPFEVLYDDMTVRVLGTEFLLSSNLTASMVTLKSGSVEVMKDSRSVMLEPYQQLTVKSGSGDFSIVELTSADMERILRGELSFKGDPLGDVLSQIGRFFGVEMELSELPATSVTIDINAGDRLDDVLFIIQQTAGNGFDYEITGTKVTVRRK